MEGYGQNVVQKQFLHLPVTGGVTQIDGSVGWKLHPSRSRQKLNFARMLTLEAKILFLS